MIKDTVSHLVEKSMKAKRKFTPPPWKIKSATYSNLVQGPTPRRSYPKDDGYRCVATFQSASDVIDDPVNAAANGQLIVHAPELYVLSEAFIEFAAKLRRDDPEITDFAKRFSRLHVLIDTLPENVHDEHQAFETGGCGLRRLSRENGEHDHQDNPNRHGPDR